MLLLSSMIRTYRISGAAWQKGQKREKQRRTEEHNILVNKRKKPIPFSNDRKSNGSTMGFPVGNSFSITFDCLSTCYCSQKLMRYCQLIDAVKARNLQTFAKMYWHRFDTAPQRPNVPCMMAAHSTEC